MGRTVGVTLMVLGLVGLAVSLIDWSAIDSKWSSSDKLPNETNSTVAAASDRSEATLPDNLPVKAEPVEVAREEKPAVGLSSVEKAGDEPTTKPAQGEEPIASPAQAEDMQISEAANVAVFENNHNADGTDSLPWVDISTPDEKTSEDSDYINFLITLSEPSERPIVIVFSTIDDTARSDEDYQSRRGTVTFKPGVVSAEIRTPLINDDIKEGDEQFSMILNGAPGVINFRNRNFVAKIRDND